MLMTIIQWVGIFYLVKLLYFFLRTVLPTIISKSLSLVNPIDLPKTYGTWAVLTGSTDGIGKAYAIQLAKRKMNLVLISRSMEKLKNTAEYIRNLYPTVEVRVIQADFSEGKKVYESIGNGLKDLDIGILVNNVGVVSPDPIFRSFDATPSDQIWNEITINAGATALMTKLVLPRMKLKRRGIIVNIGSLSSRKPHPFLTNYAATKAYMELFSKSLQAELYEYNIQVQYLYPGLVDTNMTKDNSLTAKNIPLSIQPILYPNARLYASWAVSTLGLLRHTTGYWVFDIMHFIQELETDDFFTMTMTKVLKNSYGKQLLN
ncbi:hypothetical protein M8J76_012022 [Diaphorina citri]|nr:hypothetical protein M8J76_012022 [Diaphorina citri]